MHQGIHVSNQVATSFELDNAALTPFAENFVDA